MVEMMSRPEVTYVSVKLSSVVSQLVAVDLDGSLARVCAQLRVLYRASARESQEADLATAHIGFRTVLRES